MSSIGLQMVILTILRPQQGWELPPDPVFANAGEVEKVTREKKQSFQGQFLTPIWTQKGLLRLKKAQIIKSNVSWPVILETRFWTSVLRSQCWHLPFRGWAILQSSCPFRDSLQTHPSQLGVLYFRLNAFAAISYTHSAREIIISI